MEYIEGWKYNNFNLSVDKAVPPAKVSGIENQERLKWWSDWQIKICKAAFWTGWDITMRLQWRRSVQHLFFWQRFPADLVLTWILPVAPLEVCHETCIFFIVIVRMMAAGLPYTPCSGSVQTAPRCFVQKARYWALELKGIVRYQVCVVELNANEPLMTCRNRTKLRTKLLIF